MTKQTTTKAEQQQAMRHYYRWQSKIYDATRWTFLYGREAVLNHIPFGKDEPLRILEVGCGTGKNLMPLAERYPNATLLGMDVSADMINQSKSKTAIFGERVELREQPYQCYAVFKESFDIVLFSYSLTMINPQWHDLILEAKADLKQGGCIVVADFHNSKFSWFKTHMGHNHVRMDGHLLPVLKKEFQTHYEKVSSAYGGVWEYVQFVGRKAVF